MTAPYPPVDGSQPCASVGSEPFFLDAGENGHLVGQVVAICQGCPFNGACLDYALAHDVSGIWGGTTPSQRRALRRTYGIAAVPVHDLDTSGLGWHRETA